MPLLSVSTAFTPIVGDFNGDGKTDYIMVDGRGYADQYMMMSNGDGTFTGTCEVYYSTGPSFGLVNFAPRWGGYKVSFGDFNSDGKADLFACPSSGYCASYVSTGTTFADSGFSPGWGGYQVILGDWGGVGASGLLVVPPAGAVTQYLASFASELATGIDNGLTKTTIAYSPLTNASVYVKDTTATYPVMDVQSAVNVVSRVDVSNAVGGTYSSTYTYAGAKIDPTGRGFLGFRQTTVTDLQTGISDTTTYRQDFPFVGLVASTARSAGALTLGQSTNTYQFSNASGGTTIGPTSAPYQVSLAQNVSRGADLDGTALPTVTTTNQYDAYGNATRVSVSTPDGFSKTTTNSYSNDITNWYLGRLVGASVTSVAP